MRYVRFPRFGLGPSGRRVRVASDDDAWAKQTGLARSTKKSRFRRTLIVSHALIIWRWLVFALILRQRKLNHQVQWEVHYLVAICWTSSASIAVVRERNG